MRKLIIVVTVFLLIGCVSAGNNVKQSSYDVQNERANEAFQELDRETGGQSSTEQELEKVEVEMKNKTSPGSKKQTKTEREKETLTKDKYPEKKRPDTVEQKKLPDSDYPMKNGKPVWFFNPTYDGYLGAVGIAKKSSVRGGFAARKRLAKTLAQAELAKMIRVVVKSEVETQQTEISSDVYSHYHSKLSTLSVHNAEEVVNEAVVKDVWVEEESGDLYLWLVMEK